MRLALTLGLFGANLFDALATVWVVSLGATELNPAMRFLLDAHPMAFLAFKMVPVSFAIGLAGSCLSKKSLAAFACVYFALAAYHLWGILA